MRAELTAACCAIGLITAPAHAEGTPLEMTPSGSWIAEFADDYCYLRRSFVGGGHEVFFGLKQFVPGRGFEITVASPTLPRRDRPIRAAFLPDHDPDTPRTYRLVDGEGGWQGFIYSDGLAPNGSETSAVGSPQAAARDNAITGYLIENGFASDLVLQTGSFEGVMQVMRQCTDDLLVTWGLDPTVQRTLSREVDLGKDLGWFRRYIDHSRWLEHEHDIDQLKLVLLVNEEGRATDCRGVNLPDEFKTENRACHHVLEKGEFAPALDAEGNAVASYHLFWGYSIRSSHFSPVSP